MVGIRAFFQTIIEMSGLGWSAALARWVVGILFAVSGYWKVFTLGVGGHAERFFVEAYRESWIPEWLLWALGTSIPVIELIAGALLLVGYLTRPVLVTLGLLLVVTTYGHALAEPLFDIDGHTFTRLALVMVALAVPAHHDRMRLDTVLRPGASRAGQGL
ncbi:MAG: MauE/DoxX family redox-associated membrane protein [Pseudomonadota bacterium]